MPLIDEIEAACRARGLPTDLPDRHVQRFGNMVNQHVVTESRAGRLVRQMEDYYRIKPAGTLGERFRRVQNV